MRAIPKRDDFKNYDESAKEKLYPEAFEEWAEEAENEIRNLTDGLNTIAGLGNKTGKRGEQFLADISRATLNKVNK